VRVRSALGFCDMLAGRVMSATAGSGAPLMFDPRPAEGGADEGSPGRWSNVPGARRRELRPRGLRTDVKETGKLRKVRDSLQIGPPLPVAATRLAACMVARVAPPPGEHPRSDQSPRPGMGRGLAFYAKPLACEAVSRPDRMT
jgi:hypothetical protein